MIQAKTQTLLSVSVIIPVHRITKAFTLCINSVIKELKPDYEVILVGDGLDIDDFEFISDKTQVKILANKKITGPAAVRNWGASHAKGEILFFIDSDVTLKPDILQKVVSVFQTDKELAAIIGSYDDEPSETNFISQYKNLQHHFVHQTSNESASTFWGACGAVRKEIFNSLGGYNEDYMKASIEDIEFGYRLINAGHKIRMCKDVQVKHYKKWNFPLLIKTDFLNRALPWTRLMFHHNRFINDLNLNNSNRLSVTLIFLSLIFVFSGLWDNSFLFAASTSLLLLSIINYPFYNFFRKKRGWLFAFKVVPLHWLYFFYSGIAFSIGVSIDFLERIFPLSAKKTSVVTNYLKKPAQ